MSQGQPVGGRFEIGELVHAGNTGEVYKAKDLQTGNAVAVKRVHASVFESTLARQRAERELTQLSTLSSDGVAKILAQGVDNELLWFAMAWAEGRPLNTLVGELGPLPPVNATQLIQVLGKALGDAATVGVIHRDLSAKNILVAQDGAVKLINFCIPVPGKVSGVPEFVAPEQVDGKPVDLRSNIYSVGAVLYMLLTGKPPHTGDAEAVYAGHKNTTPAPPSSIMARVPASVDEVVRRALEKNPSKRFMTLPQLLSALDDAAKQPVGAAVEKPAADSLSMTQPLGKANVASKPTGKGKAPAPAKTLLGMPAIKASDAEAAAGKADKAPEGPKTEPMAAQSADADPAIGGAIEEKQAVSGPQDKTLLAGQAPSKSALKTTDPATPLAKQADAKTAEPEVATPAPAPDPTPVSQPAAATEPTPTPEPAAAAQPAPTPKPAAAVQPTPTPEPAPAAQPSPTPTPEPAAAQPSPTPTPAVAAAEPAPAPEPVKEPFAPKAASTPKAAALPATGKSTGKTTGKGTGRNKAVSNAPQKTKKKGGKFRETMWFKKGDLDAAAAQAAAKKAQQGEDALAADKADSLPMEDRYKDDGSISNEDRQQHSLRTGNTEMMQAVSAEDVRRSMEADGGVTEQDLIADMQSGRNKMIVAVVVGLIAVIGLVAFLAT